MLASDSDTESAEWDSDSEGSDAGPLKQAWGSKDLKNRKGIAKFDFVSNLPQDGEEFLQAVLLERKKTPSCVAADKTVIEEIRKRKSTGKEKTEGGSGSSEGQKEGEQVVPTAEGIDAQLEKLKLEDSSVEGKPDAKAEVKTEKEPEPDVQEIMRFLPTAKWRANRVSQFNYIRIKMDLMRDMILQGKVYLIPSFSAFEKDRIYWLRYCFGTLDAGKMIDMKRAKKIRAKELYDAKKKLKAGLDSKESPDDSQDSDVEIVCKEEVTKLSKKAGEDSAPDDLMKISGGSMDELVVVPSSSEPERGDTSEAGKDAQVDSEEAKADSEQAKVDEPGAPEITFELNIPVTADPAKESGEAEPQPSKSDLTEPSDAPVEPDSTVISPAPAVAAKDPEGTKDMNIAVETVKTMEESVTTTTSAVVVDEEFVDPTVEHRKLHGQQPTTNLLLSMPQRLTEYLLTLQLDWLREFGLINRKQGSWMFAIMTALQVPFEPDVISDLRQVALQCVRIRDIAKGCILQSGIPMEDKSHQETLEEPTYPVINSEDSFGLEDVISSCNLFISIVVDYFVQKDLNKYLTVDGKEEF